jgi:hypothetical protein
MLCRWQLAQLAYEGALQLSPARDADLEVSTRFSKKVE